MDIATDGYRRIDGDDVAFFDQKFTRLVAQFADLGLGDQAAGPQLLDRSAKELSASAVSGDRSFEQG